MPIELKPCPFCGGKAVLKVKETTYGACGAYILCQKCGTRTRYYETHEMIRDGKRLSTPVTPESRQRGIDKAAEAWNRRADDEVQQRM